MTPTQRFRLRALGGLSIESVDGVVPAAANQRKRLAFLALLAASAPRGISRERLLLLLWPESTTDRARGALYQLLHVVRQAFGEESVVGTDELRLDTNIVGSDVSDFTEAVARGDLTAAIELYTGPFLDAVHLTGAPELDRWVEQKRQELSRSHESALARLATQSMNQRDYSAAIALAERLVAANPLSERATVLLMEALAAAGDVTAALERARAHAAIVREELGGEVDASVSALAARLRSESKSVNAVARESPREKINEPVPPVPSPSGTPVRRQNRTIVWATAAIAVVGVALVLAMREPREPHTEVVVLADFATAPADSQIADVLTDVTRRVLGESRSLRPAPDARLSAARQRLQLPPNARLTPALARQIAVGEGIRSVVTGTLNSFGGSYSLSLRLVSAATGETLATAEKPGIATSQVYEALGDLTRDLRQRAGDDLEAIRAQPSIVALTSNSLEAMTDYVTAIRLPRDSVARTVALLREAVRLDTAFASALWRLSYFVELMGPHADAEHRAFLERAWKHRDRLTEYEQLRVEIAYKYSENGTTPDPDEHLEHLRQVVERYPNSLDAMILANMYFGRRNLTAAEREYRRAITLDSLRPEGFLSLASTYLKTNRIRDARRAADDIARRFPESINAKLMDLLVSYAEGRHDRMREILGPMIASTGQARIAGYNLDASLDLLEGRAAAWERRMREKDSLPAPQRKGPGLRTARLLANYWVFNRSDQALRMLEESVAADPALRFDLGVAEYYAQLGAPDSARALLAARGTSDQTRYYRGTDTLAVSAWIDLAEGRPRVAAVKFHESLRFLGGSDPSQNLRDAEIGLAFERAGVPDSAIASYEHYLKPTPVWDLDIYKLQFVLEHVAVLYDKKGDRRKAKAAYERLADMWKDADPELQSRVKHARERAAAL